MRMETAIISHYGSDAMPHLHSFERDLDFGDIAIERAYARRGGARGMAPRPPPLEHHHATARAGEMQGSREPVQAATDHGDIECLHVHLAGSCSSRLASSPRVTGFSGGRMRKSPTSATGRC